MFFYVGNIGGTEYALEGQVNASQHTITFKKPSLGAFWIYGI
jgi:hypothetical protein